MGQAEVLDAREVSPEDLGGGTSVEAGGDRRVLIVEDDAFLRQLLRLSLRRAGYEVLEAADGSRAWEVLQKQRVPLVLMDWMMPGIDGPALVRRIRAAGWAHYTYVIMLTALREEHEVVEGMNAGADDYLTKPFSREVLLAQVAAGARIIARDASLRASLAHETDRASRDDLTGLLTRRAALERVAAEINRAKRDGTSIGVIFADLDNLKQVNDLWGHEAGDQALRIVGRLLQRELRDYDIAARWGGDEFLLLLPGVTRTQAIKVAERLRVMLIATPLPYGDAGPEPLHLSLGVTVAEAAGATGLRALLRQADQALYRAKEEGRNRVCVFDPPEAPAADDGALLPGVT
jgi:two-component system, cell cycle response regulator